MGRRDLASLSREKTIVLAILIQLFVAAFSSFLVVGLTSLYDPGSVESGEVAVGISGEEVDALGRAAARRDGVEAVAYPSETAARQAFQRGDVDAVLHAERSQGRIAVSATAPQGSLRTTLIVVQLRGLLETMERQQRAARSEFLDSPVVPVPPPVDASPYFGFTYTVLIPLLLFLPPFISGSIAVDAITEEIERETMELLRVAPVSLVDIVDGKAAAMIALAPVQAGAWILLMTFNGFRVSNPWLVLSVVTALTVVVVALGVALGLRTGTRRQAQLLYSVGALGLFGGAVFLPEHPATTVAKLAVDSPSPTTYALVAGYAVVAVVAYAAVRRYTGRVDAASL
ncbi:ABC transporter permease [Halobacteriales archaeon QS_1_68_17]|nr:MAG: ABC transporter permease [Halobacteriales archaeon QS_1_68_17]